VIRQTKIIQTLHYVIIIINSQRHLPNLPLPNLLRTEFAKLSSRQTFLPYSSNNLHCAKHKQHAKHAEAGAMPPEVHML